MASAPLKITALASGALILAALAPAALLAVPLPKPRPIPRSVIPKTAQSLSQLPAAPKLSGAQPAPLAAKPPVQAAPPPQALTPKKSRAPLAVASTSTTSKADLQALEQIINLVRAKRQSDATQLQSSIHDPLVEVWVLYVDGTPAGYGELDRRTQETDLSYFGLIPDFFGHKLGPWLLDSIIRKAWDGGAAKLLVNTCTFDHPKALPLYQSMGFVPTRHVAREVRDPRLDGVIPRSAGEHIPLAR